MIDFVGLLVLVVLLVLFGWLFWRAFHSERALLKWVGLLLTGLLTLIFALVLVVGVLGTLKLNTNYNADHPAANLKVAGTPEQIARGAQLTKICSCHGEQLEGHDFFGSGGPPVGTFYASNLTMAGELKSWTDGEIIRAFREGVHKSGRSLVIMPAQVFKHMSDEDAQAIVAYLRSAPAVTPDTPANNLNVLGAIFVSVASAQTVQPHIAQPITRPPQAPTSQYGKYVTTIWCIACHGENLAGGKAGGSPVGPNLSALVPKWTADQFTTTIRTGVDPNGHALNSDPTTGMPWQAVSSFATDDDLKALYAYLHELQPLPTNPTQ